MRTIPTPISTGLSTYTKAFWLVKLEGSVTTYYWTTASKNLDATPATLVLKDATVTKTYDSTIIAKTVDGQEVIGLGAMESSVDISMGGGASSVSDFEIEILNQDRFDSTILAASNQFENRAVTVYFGFIPTGVTPTVEITSDMLQMWTGVVDDILDFDYSSFFIRCVDGTFQRHREIPTSLIDKNTYPFAPEENIGKPFPLLYGDFQTYTGLTLAEAITSQNHSPAPSILYDENQMKFAFAGHQMNMLTHSGTLGNPDYYAYDSSAKIFPLYASTTTINAASGTPGYAQFTGKTTACDVYMQPKRKGDSTVTTSPSDFYLSVDDNSDTYSTIDSTGIATIALRLNTVPSTLQSTNIQVIATIYFGTISGGATGFGRYKLDGGAWTNANTFTNADSNGSMTIILTSIALSDLINYEFGVIVSGGTCQIVNASVKISAIVIEDFDPLIDYYIAGSRIKMKKSWNYGVGDKVLNTANGKFY